MDLRVALEAFLADAEEVITRDHVLPRPRHAPWITIGRDYFGPELSHLPSLTHLEAAIEATHERFSDDVDHSLRDFPSRYVFDALEFYVARSTQGDVDAASSAYEALIDGLHLPRTIASAWAVTDITTSAPEPLRIGGVEIHRLPEVGAGTHAEMGRLFRMIFGERAAQLDQDRLHHPFPEAALLVATHDTSETFEGAAVPPSSQQVGDVVLAVRLLHAATAHTVYEIRGRTISVGPHGPSIYDFEGAGQGTMSSGLDARRVARLTPDDELGITTLINLLHGQLGSDAEPSNLQTAVGRYQMSHHRRTWSDKIIDLSIALEAALSGDTHTEITFRLQSRAAALLATDRDSEADLFDDIKHFYTLRSQFVHGSAVSDKTIEKTLRKISRVPKDEHFGVFRSDAVVDRLRDVVRRAILARLFIAANAPDLWPRNDTHLDRAILTHSGTTTLRDSWRTPLLDMGQAAAVEAAPQFSNLSS